MTIATEQDQGLQELVEIARKTEFSLLAENLNPTRQEGAFYRALLDFLTDKLGKSASEVQEVRKSVVENIVHEVELDENARKRIDNLVIQAIASRFNPPRFELYEEYEAA